MTAEIVNIRDHQSPKAREAARKAMEEHLAREAMEIANMAFPSVFGFPEEQHRDQDRPA